MRTIIVLLLYDINSKEVIKNKKMGGSFSDFTVTKGYNSSEPDTLRIKGTGITAVLHALKFVDADTKQKICYLPSFNISGYGDTEEKAIEMVKFSVSEFFSYLIDLSQKKREAEFASLGWKIDKLKNKEFSKASVNLDGKLENFNAEEGKIEYLILEAA